MKKGISIIACILLIASVVSAASTDSVTVSFTPGSSTGGTESINVGFSQAEVKDFTAPTAQDNVVLKLDKTGGTASYQDGALHLYYQIMTSTNQEITISASEGLKTTATGIDNLAKYINYTVTVNDVEMTTKDSSPVSETVFSLSALKDGTAAAGSFPVTIVTGTLPGTLSGTYEGTLTVTCTTVGEP